MQQAADDFVNEVFAEEVEARDEVTHDHDDEEMEDLRRQLADDSVEQTLQNARAAMEYTAKVLERAKAARAAEAAAAAEPDEYPTAAERLDAAVLAVADLPTAPDAAEPLTYVPKGQTWTSWLASMGPQLVRQTGMMTATALATSAMTPFLGPTLASAASSLVVGAIGPKVGDLVGVVAAEAVDAVRGGVSTEERERRTRQLIAEQPSFLLNAISSGATATLAGLAMGAIVGDASWMQWSSVVASSLVTQDWYGAAQTLLGGLPQQAVSRVLYYVLDNTPVRHVFGTTGEWIEKQLSKSRALGTQMLPEKFQRKLRQKLTEHGYDAKWVGTTFAGMAAALSMQVAKEASVQGLKTLPQTSVWANAVSKLQPINKVSQYALASAQKVAAAAGRRIKAMASPRDVIDGSIKEVLPQVIALDPETQTALPTMRDTVPEILRVAAEDAERLRETSAALLEALTTSPSLEVASQTVAEATRLLEEMPMDRRLETIRDTYRVRGLLAHEKTVLNQLITQLLADRHLSLAQYNGITALQEASKGIEISPVSKWALRSLAATLAGEAAKGGEAALGLPPIVSTVMAVIDDMDSKAAKVNAVSQLLTVGANIGKFAMKVVRPPTKAASNAAVIQDAAILVAETAQRRMAYVVPSVRQTVLQGISADLGGLLAKEKPYETVNVMQAANELLFTTLQGAAASAMAGDKGQAASRGFWTGAAKFWDTMSWGKDVQAEPITGAIAKGIDVAAAIAIEHPDLIL